MECGDRGLSRVAGRPAAVSATAATIVLFWGGIVYAKAWSNCAPPNPRLNRSTRRRVSGIGVILLGTGLIMMGNTLLVASAGVLHAAEKFGRPWVVQQRGKDLSSNCALPISVRIWSW